MCLCSDCITMNSAEHSSVGVCCWPTGFMYSVCIDTAATVSPELFGGAQMCKYSVSTSTTGSTHTLALQAPRDYQMATSRKSPVCRHRDAYQHIGQGCITPQVQALTMQRWLEMWCGNIAAVTLWPGLPGSSVAWVTSRPPRLLVCLRL